MYFIGSLYDRFVGHKKETIESEVLTILEHKPTDKAATTVATDALKRVQKDGQTIDHFLNVFSAIEASAEAYKVKKSGSAEKTAMVAKETLYLTAEEINSDQFDQKPIKNLAGKKVDSVESLYNQFNPEDGNEDESKVGSESSPSVLTIKQLRKEFPSQKRAAIDSFDDKLARLQAACFGFTARYNLFEAVNDKFFSERSCDSLENYSMLDVYKDAVCFLKKITPKYHSRDFFVERLATSATSNEPKSPAKAKKNQPKQAIANPSPLEQKLGSYFERFPQYQNLRKLILFYKQEQKIMPHEEIPLVKPEGGTTPKPYMHPQTQARVDLSLYDYYIIHTLLEEKSLHGPLVSNLLASHKELIAILGDDGKIEPIHLLNGADPLKKMEFRRDPWMAGFVTSVLRHRIPLSLFVLFPDLSKKLEEAFMGKRIGSLVGVEFNEPSELGEFPISLLGNEDVVKCTYGPPCKVEFKVFGQWINITTEEDRDKNIHAIFQENGWDNQFAPNETFNGIVKHYVENSKGWISYEIVLGHGVKTFNKHDQTFVEIKTEERGPHDEIPESKRPQPLEKHKTADKFDIENYLFTRKAGDDTDPTNRDHFSTQLTSLDDLSEQYPDYDLTGLKQGKFAIFWCSNRKSNNLGLDLTHSFIKLVVPEEGRPGICRVINMGYTPTEFTETMAERGIDCGSFNIPQAEDKKSTYGSIVNMIAHGLAPLNIYGRSAKGSFHVDLDPVYSDRDRIGQGFVLDDQEFKKVCDVIQDQINKTRKEELSFNAYGMNCAHRITKIMRKTVGANFNDTLRELLTKARNEKLDNLSIIEKIYEFISEYILFRSAEDRALSFLQNLKFAIDSDDIDALDDILAELIPYLGEEDSATLFDETAKFLADVHLRNLKKFKASSADAENAAQEFAGLLDEATRKQANLKPYKQFTAEDDDVFFNTITDNMTTYESAVTTNLTAEERKAEMAKILKDLIIQGVKAASPYATSFYDADFGPGEILIDPIRNIQNKYLRRFILCIVIFLFIAPYRTRTVEKTDDDGNAYTKDVSLWSKADPERFKIPPKIFETVRRNDEFVVQEAILCKKMILLQQAQAAAKAQEAANTAIANGE